MTRKAIGKQLAYLRRDLDAIDGKLSIGKNLPSRQAERLGTIRAVYEQQKYMYDNRTHSVPDRIVSVSQPFVRPIVRGKAGKPVEFGAKLDISVVDGWTRLECCSFDAYNEAGNLREMAERFRAREGHYPSRILADKIYRNRENLSYCKAHGIRLSGPALGRPKKGETRDKAQDYRDECERVEVERRFSLAKRKCGMGLVTAKLRETAAHVIAMSVLVLNLRKIQRALLRMLAYLLEILAWTLFIGYAPAVLRHEFPLRNKKIPRNSPRDFLPNDATIPRRRRHRCHKRPQKAGCTADRGSAEAGRRSLVSALRAFPPERTRRFGSSARNGWQ